MPEKLPQPFCRYVTLTAEQSHAAFLPVDEGADSEPPSILYSYSRLCGCVFRFMG
jgi:hypothetical protein